MKKSITEGQINLVYNNPVSLITSSYEGEKNIFTVSWLCAVSKHPQLVMISVDKKRASLPLIKKSGRFVVNIPNTKMLKDVIYCGNVSKNDKDKFQERKLEFSVSDNEGIILDKAIAYLECKVVNEFDVGDHLLFIGEIVDARADEEVFSNGKWNLSNLNAKTLSFSGEGKYVTNCEID